MTFSTVVKTVCLLALLVALYLVRDLVLAILVSVVIAAAVEPLVRWLGRLRLPRAPAVILIYLLTFGLLIGLLPFFLFPLLGDLSSLSVTLPELLGGLPQWVSGRLSFTGFEISGFSLAGIADALQNNLLNLPKGFVQTASLIFGGFFTFILIVVISFYLAVQPNGLENFIRLVTPVTHEKYFLGLWHRSRQKIGYWMQGQLLLGILIGILVFLGLTLFNLRYALVLAILAAVFELIPFFGPVLAAVPAALLGFSDSVGLGFLVLGFYVIIQQFENHLIYPLVVTKMVGVPPLVVILALLVGGQLLGFMGIILAVPAAAVLMELASDWEKQKALGRPARNV